LVTTIVTLLIQFLPIILQSAGVITPSMQTLIQQLGAALPGLITSLSQGKGATADIMAVLEAAQAEIGALIANNPGLPAATLQTAAELDKAITASLAAYTEAGKVTDPSTLTPLPTNL
jgi:hypothetical protein